MQNVSTLPYTRTSHTHSNGDDGCRQFSWIARQQTTNQKRVNRNDHYINRVNLMRRRWNRHTRDEATSRVQLEYFNKWFALKASTVASTIELLRAVAQTFITMSWIGINARHGLGHYGTCSIPTNSFVYSLELSTANCPSVHCIEGVTSRREESFSESVIVGIASRIYDFSS